MQAEPMQVHETRDSFKSLAGLLITVLTAAISIGTVIYLITRLETVNIHVMLLLFIGIGVIPTVLVNWLFSLQKKTTVTPVMHIDGTIFDTEPINESEAISRRTESQDITKINRPVRNPIEKARSNIFPDGRRKLPCIKITLCEEGVVLYRAGDAGLVRWEKIREMRADREQNRFEFTVKRMLGRDSFAAPERFDEVKQMLARHISIN